VTEAHLRTCLMSTEQIAELIYSKKHSDLSKLLYYKSMVSWWLYFLKFFKENSSEIPR
jgi:hypothetical protein